MSFEVSADSYARFIGRFSEPLAEQFAAGARLTRGERVLDVGCGPGALTAQLVERLGAAAVSAVDPSPPFVDAVRARLAGVDVRLATAEDLPFADDGFDAALAQLVVHFMTDPVAGLAEMRRVTRPGGLVGACVWDHGGGGSPLDVFWQAVRDTDPSVDDESGLAGAREGHLAELCQAAGLASVESTSLSVTVPFATLEEWWGMFTLGVGPAGAYVAGLDESRRELLRGRCAQLLPHPPFRVEGSAWCVWARA